MFELVYDWCYSRVSGARLMGGLWMAGCGLWAGGEFVAIEILNVGHVQTSLFSLVGRAPA